VPGYDIRPLQKSDDRSRFLCGAENLDRYLRQQAGQEFRRRVASCFVAIEDQAVAGYYTLSATGILLSDLPADKKLPRYPEIPAVLLGRLAVDLRHRGRGLGGLLLIDAFSRAIRSEIAVYAVVVDAKDNNARQFYEHYGFRPLAKEGRRLFLPMAEVVRLFASPL
jgi:GNAT superfamily N-acetyltransferase